MNTQKRVRYGFVWVALIPVIFLVFSALMRMAAGPFWLGANSDPAYLYLINSLYFFEHISPSFVDHPGTTLQLLGAGLIKLVHWSQDSQQIIDQVLLDPEYHLRVIYYVILFLNGATLFLAGFYALKRSRDLTFALLAQSGALVFLILKSYKASHYVLPVSANMFAESLFPLIDHLLIIGLCVVFFSEERRTSFIKAVLFGVVGALGVITKASFAPLLIIPFLLVRGWRAKAGFLGALAISSFILTIPIIPEYKEMLHYIYLFQANRGFHGTGGVGFMGWHEWSHNALRFLREHLFFSVCWAVFLVTVGTLIVLRKRIPWQERTVRKSLYYSGVIGLGILVQILFVIKHPAPHYAAPAMGLLGIWLAFMYWPVRKAGRMPVLWFQVLLGLIVVGFSLRAIHYQQRLRDTNQAQYAFSQKVYKDYPDCIICHHYRSSAVPYALYFGDDCKGRHRAFFPRLKELYPKALVWNRWDYTFHHFPDQVSENSLINATDCLLLYGGPVDFSRSYINAKLMESSGTESVYKVTGSHRAKAMRWFLLAKAYEIKKDYETSLKLAKKAKEAGFPQLRVQRYINDLKGKLVQGPSAKD
jgi:hypothetical protein